MHVKMNIPRVHVPLGVRNNHAALSAVDCLHMDGAWGMGPKARGAMEESRGRKLRSSDYTDCVSRKYSRYYTTLIHTAPIILLCTSMYVSTAVVYDTVVMSYHKKYLLLLSCLWPGLKISHIFFV